MVNKTTAVNGRHPNNHKKKMYTGTSKLFVVNVSFV